MLGSIFFESSMHTHKKIEFDIHSKFIVLLMLFHMNWKLAAKLFVR